MRIGGNDVLLVILLSRGGFGEDCWKFSSCSFFSTIQLRYAVVGKDLDLLTVAVGLVGLVMMFLDFDDEDDANKNCLFSSVNRTLGD